MRGPPGNLMGSLDSLDCYVNASGCYDVFRARMQLGLVSREGWSVVDDTQTALWDGDAVWPWRRERAAPATLDLYVFGHGHDYRRALGDFVKLAGPVPIKPWKAHGVWHSRCMPMSEPLMHEVVALYQQKALPLNMFVFDYGWHVGPYDPANVSTCAQVCMLRRRFLVDNYVSLQCLFHCVEVHQPKSAGGQCLAGYGGYAFDATYFPDPQRAIRWAHSQELELVLNIHDQCGIDQCQSNYAAVAARTGVDPASGDAVACRFLDKAYALAQSELVLESGDLAEVDYWCETRALFVLRYDYSSFILLLSMCAHFSSLSGGTIMVWAVPIAATTRPRAGPMTRMSTRTRTACGM